VEAFSATLGLDPKLLRPLRHSLASWLERAGAPAPERDSVVLATHEAVAHAIESGESGGTLDVTADRDGDGAFVVHVRSDGVFAVAGSDVPGSAMALVAALMSETSTRVSNTVRMRSSARLR
jgi:hypothetical protein